MKKLLFLVCAPLPLLLACPGGGGSSDSGASDTSSDGGTVEEDCWVGGSDAASWTGDQNDAFPSECDASGLATWVSSEDLWDWHHFLDDADTDPSTLDDQEWVTTAAEDLVASLDTARDPIEVRHSMAFLASAVVAGTIDDDDYPGGYHPDGGTSLGWGCQVLEQYAACGLEQFESPTACVAVPDTFPVPPPAGNDPEDFCSSMIQITSATHPDVTTNHLTCTATPLSNALSFIAAQQGAQSTNFWLALTAADGASPHLAWWPAWMAAYAGDAPALMMFTAVDGTNNVPGLMAVQQIEMEVRGHAALIEDFDKWIHNQLLGDGTVATPSGLNDLTFVLPSKLVYRSYPATSGGVVTGDNLHTWTPGAPLYLPDGNSVPFVFTKLVGVIDPCRGNPESDSVIPTACTNNGLSWVGVVDQLVAAGQDAVFEPGESVTGCP